MKIHELLNLAEDIPEIEIRKKYRFTCPHPDRGGDILQFMIWNQAFGEWEKSLIEETPVQKYLRHATKQALKKTYETPSMRNEGFDMDFTSKLILQIDTDLTKAIENLKEIIAQEKSFRNSKEGAQKRIKDSETLKIIISEIDNQLKNVPDLLAFINQEIEMFKEAKKSVELKKHTTTQMPDERLSYKKAKLT